jgi:zinc transport system ATP-binding protein
MKKLGITDLAGRNFRELSGGQRQRVMLARALCATKKLLVLDEPAAGLDVVAIRELYDIIAKLNRDERITVIMMTGDRAVALHHATHILHINHDESFFSTKDEYISQINK